MEQTLVRHTWLVRKRESFALAFMYVTFTIVWSCIGWLLVHPFADSFIAHMDRSVSEWFVRQRTSGLDSLTVIGSTLSDSTVKIAVTAVVALGMLWRWKRWREPLMVVVPLILEALSFITITFIVGRPRPNVVRLDSSPVGSSFPSGHMAAAVAYAAIVVVVFWHTRRLWIRALSVVVGVVVPVFAGLSRMYRGMHYLTDVVFGGLLGAASVIATVIILQRSEAHRVANTAEPTQHDSRPVMSGVGEA